MDTVEVPSAGTLIAYVLISLAVVVVAVIGLWRTFAKAGKPGWGAIVPIYNAYLLIKIAGRPGWWLVLLFIPLVNIVILFIVAIDVAKAFGKSGAFGFFLLGLLGIGYLIIGFGKARYLGTGTQATQVLHTRY